MDSERPESEARGLSRAGWAWLAFWVILLATTAALIVWAPWVFELKGGRRRGVGRFREIRAEDIPGILLLIAWFGGVFGWVAWFRARQRSLALELVSKELGLAYRAKPTEDDWSLIRVFPLFLDGENGEARNMMIGKFGKYDVVLIDYSFALALDAFGTKKTYDQTVAAFIGAAPDLPNFQLLAREGWWARSFAGGKRRRKAKAPDLAIGKEENPEFQRQYQVGAEEANQTDLQNVFNHALMNFLVEHPGWDVEAADGNLLVYREGQKVPPANWPKFLEEAAVIAAAIAKTN